MPQNKLESSIIMEEKKIIVFSGRKWAYTRFRPKDQIPRERMILNHSIFFDRHLWDELAKSICLKYNMEIYSFDLPGHGESTKDMTDVNYQTIQSDLLNIIDTLQIAPFHYMGCSIGSEWGLRLSITHPDYIKTLVVIGPSCLEATGEEIENMENLIEDWKKKGMPALAELMFKEPLWFTIKFLTDDKFKETRKIEKERVSKLNISTLHIMSLWNKRKITFDYSLVKCPILIMCGADDEYFLPHAEHLISLIPHGRLEFIPDAAHEGPIENPEKCIEFIDSFFEKL